MSDSAQESQKRHFSKIRPHVLGPAEPPHFRSSNGEFFAWNDPHGDRTSKSLDTQVGEQRVWLNVWMSNSGPRVSRVGRGCIGRMQPGLVRRSFWRAAGVTCARS